ncbi:PadR family transcriptional regulator [Streptomyces orinoci]|uniref:PadR family transcriptional regulator n=1 Tax=Streptomyces orinoci TaxID=67339 RepID=A0ABV3JWG1_STRON|nr:PadR family transcriptional regulator [Streptomyces orinoci]
MVAKRKVNNPLALAVLTVLAERPMHQYGIARLLRLRGKEQSIKINYGSLSTVVHGLRKHGLIEVSGVQRQGNRPERTVYALTAEGRREMHDWLAELVAVPAREFPLFETALSLLPALHIDEARELLGRRLATRRAQAAAIRADLTSLTDTLPRVVLIELEFQLHMIEAEIAWIQGFQEELDRGTLGGAEVWREISETGRIPDVLRDLEDITD